MKSMIILLSFLFMYAPLKAENEKGIPSKNVDSKGQVEEKRKNHLRRKKNRKGIVGGKRKKESRGQQGFCSVMDLAFMVN